jgi:hypothetical protein
VRNQSEGIAACRERLPTPPAVVVIWAVTIAKRQKPTSVIERATRRKAPSR